MRAHHYLVFSMVLAACSTEATTDDKPLDPAPPPGGQQLATGTYRLEPGEEKYMCYQFYSPDDRVGITRIDSISMPGVHHIGLYQAFGRNEPDAPHECETLIKQTWLPIWGSGTGSVSLEMPAGAAFVIEPGTQYIVQLHLQNSTDEVMDLRGGINLTYDRDVAALQPAGMYAFGTFQMEIPPKAQDYQVKVDNCQTGKQMNVFAAFPHMHKLGTKQVVTRAVGGSGGQQPFFRIDPWEFGHQPIIPMTVEVGPDDNFELTCHYDNPTDAPITHGESSDQEMCFFVLFYYPYTGLDGCVVGA